MAGPVEVDIVNLILLQMAKEIASDVMSEVADIREEISSAREVWSELMESWYSNSTRMQSFANAFASAQFIFSTLREYRQEIRETDNGYAAISVAFLMMSFWNDKSSRIRMIPELLYQIREDLDINSRVSRYARKYRESTYIIKSLF